MIPVFKNFNQDIHFLFLKFILLFLLIEHFNINIFSFDVIGNRIISSFRALFIIQYFLLLFLSSFYHLSRSVFFFCIHSGVVEGLIRVDFLRDIGPGLTYNVFIGKNCNKRLSRIK